MVIQHSGVLKGMFLSAAGFACWSAGDAASKWLSEHYAVVEISFLFAAVATILFSLLSPKLGGFTDTLKTQKKVFHFARGL